MLTIIQRGIGDFEDIFNTSDSQSVCNADKSGDQLVKFSDGKIISHNLSKRNIDDHLKTIREEKHKVYLQNTGLKSLILENNENNKNSRQ